MLVYGEYYGRVYKVYNKSTYFAQYAWNSVCAIRTRLGVERKILSIKREPILSGFLRLNS